MRQIIATTLLLGAPAAALAQGTTNAPELSPQEIARTILDTMYPSAWNDGELFERIERVMPQLVATPMADVLIRNWVTLARAPGASQTVWRKLTAWIENPKLHGVAKRRLRDELARRLRDLGKSDEADKMSPTGEYIRHALAIGPFGDSGSLFHGVPYPPEQVPLRLDAAFPGRFGAVRFRHVERPARRTRIDLRPEGSGKQGAGCHYAIVQLNSESARDAWLELYCAGSFESWFNGVRAASINRYTQRLPTTSYVPVSLVAGWNRFLLKTTAQSVATFSLRIVDDAGHALTGISDETGRTLHAQPKRDAPLKPRVFQTAATLARAWAKDAPNPHTLALAANLTARDARPDHGIALLREAAKSGPKDKTFLAAALGTWQLARHLPGDLVRTEQRAILDEIQLVDGALDSSHRYLFQRKIDRLFADDKKEQALRQLDQRLAQNPKDLATLAQKYRLLGQLRWRGEAQRALENLLLLAPHHPAYVIAAAKLEEDAGNPQKALDRIEQELADYPGRRDLLGRATSLSRRVGDSKREERYLGLLNRDNPQGYTAQSARASLHERRGELAKAVQVLEEVSKKRPRDSSLHRRVGDLEFRAGNTDAARRHYRRSLSLRPDQHELRSWILRSAGVEEFLECKPWALDPLAEVAAFEPRAEDAATPSTLVLDQMVIRVYRDGSQMEETHVLRRINDRRGIEAYEESRQAAEADELLELRTIHTDGRWFAPHRVAGTFSMPRLEPGCFIEERYRNFKNSPGRSPIEFVRFFFSGIEQPYRFSRLVVIMPKEQEFGSFVRRNFPDADVTKTDMDGDLTAFVFLKKDMPKIDNERDMPPLDEVVPWVTFGKDREHGPFVREQRFWFDHMTIPYAEVVAKATELCKGKQTDLEKARAIHEFVHEVTPDASRRPGSPYPVSVLLKGEGDRFALQIALLRSAGIAWKPALIHPIPPEMDLEPEPLLNNPSFYRVRAVRVMPRGAEPFWIVQGTPRYYPFARQPTTVLGNPLAGCPYLMLEGNSGVPGKMPGGDLSGLVEAKIRASLALRDGRAIVQAEIRFPAEGGFQLKEFIRSASRSRQRVLANQLATVFFRGFTVRKWNLLGIDQADAEFGLSIRAEKDGFVDRDRSGSSIRMLMRPSSLVARFGGRGSRKHPLVWTSYLVSDWQVTIDPGEQRFASIPPGLLLRRMVFDYGLSFDLAEDGKLRIHRRSILRPGRIAPDRYREFLSICRQIDNTETRRLRLVD